MTYDAANRELAFDFTVGQQTSQLQRTLDLSPEKANTTRPANLKMPLYGLAVNTPTTPANVLVGAALEFTLGIDLDKTPGAVAAKDYFLDAMQLAGTVDLNVSQVAFTGSYGFLGVQSSGGTGESHLVVALDGLEQRRHVSHALPTTNVDVSGTADFRLKNFVPTDNAFPVSGNKEAHFTWSDLGNLGTRSLTVPSEFLCYQYLAYEDLVEMLEGANDFVQSLAAHATFTTGLPVIDKRLEEFQTFADNFKAAVTAVAKAPKATVQALEKAIETMIAKELGLATGAVQVTMNFSCQQVTARIEFTKPLVDRTDSLNLKVQGYDLTGGSLQTKATAKVDLLLGLDLLNSSNPRPFLGDPVLDSDPNNDVGPSRVDVTVSVVGTNIQAKVAIGPLGVFVKDGKAAFTKDDTADLSKPAEYGFALKPIAGGKYYLDQPVGMSNVNVTSTTSWHVQLPLYFPKDDLALGGTTEDNDEDGYPDHWIVFKSNSSPSLVAAPDISAAINSVGVLDYLLVGLEKLFDEFTATLKEKLLTLDLPLVGKGLDSGLSFVQQIKDKVFAEINAAPVKTPQVVQQAR